MAELTFNWIEIPGALYQISDPEQTSRGDWFVAIRFGALQWKNVTGPTRGSSIFRAVETAEHDREYALATLATGNAPLMPATEPTPIGLQYVIPGCEKDQTRGPAQMSLF